jgi:hypothetical protein
MISETGAKSAIYFSFCDGVDEIRLRRAKANGGYDADADFTTHGNVRNFLHGRETRLVAYQVEGDRAWTELEDEGGDADAGKTRAAEALFDGGVVPSAPAAHTDVKVRIFGGGVGGVGELAGVVIEGRLVPECDDRNVFKVADTSKQALLVNNMISESGAKLTIYFSFCDGVDKIRLRRAKANARDYDADADFTTGGNVRNFLHGRETRLVAYQVEGDRAWTELEDEGGDADAGKTRAAEALFDGGVPRG